jgi:hypothetical protein
MPQRNPENPLYVLYRLSISDRILQANKLFQGCKFYFHGQFTNPSKEELSSLLTVGQAKILSTMPKPAKNIAEVLKERTFVIVDPNTLQPEDIKEIYFKTARGM